MHISPHFPFATLRLCGKSVSLKNCQPPQETISLNSHFSLLLLRLCDLAALREIRFAQKLPTAARNDLSQLSPLTSPFASLRLCGFATLRGIRFAQKLPTAARNDLLIS